MRSQAETDRLNTRAAACPFCHTLHGHQLRPDASRVAGLRDCYAFDGRTLRLVVAPSTYDAILIADGEAWVSGDLESHYALRAEAINASQWFTRNAVAPLAYVSLMQGGV